MGREDQMSQQRLEIVDPANAPPVWAALRNEAEAAAQQEAALASLLAAVILNHKTLGGALSYQLARKLGDQELRAMSIREIAEEAYATSPGFVALQTQRVAHWLWAQERETLALYLQSRMSELFQVDIHPATKIGRGVFVDHGAGIVIGETAVIGDDVSMLQGVTLGGTGAERGDRHPKIGKGVLLGAGAKVLGNITIGDYAKVASGSVVLKPVPPGCTAAGVPARLVNCPTCDEPAKTMDHTMPEIMDYVICGAFARL